MEPQELNDSDRALLDALADGRATPAALLDWTGLSKQTVHSRLNVLVAAGHVEKVHDSGLYELADDPRETVGHEEGGLADEILLPTDKENDDVGEDTGDVDELADLELPGTVNRDEALAAIRAAEAYVRESGGATKAEIIRHVMPEYPLGYDLTNALTQIDTGESYRGPWWRRVMSKGLKALDTVEAPAAGGSKWRPADEA